MVQVYGLDAASTASPGRDQILTSDTDSSRYTAAPPLASVRDMLKFKDIANIHSGAIARRSRRSWLKITRQLYTFLSADAFLITPTTIMPSANPQCRRLYSWRRDKRALPSHCQHHDVVCALKTTPSSV